MIIIRSRFFLVISFVLITSSLSFSQIELSHNVGNTLIDTGMGSCSEAEWWAKVFKLSDFGITTNDDFVIDSGNIGLQGTSFFSQPNLMQFNIYEIDSDFPSSFSTSNLIGSSQIEPIPFVWNSGPPQIITVQFDNPVIVPANVEHILVEVTKFSDSSPNSDLSAVFVAGTEYDNDVSWYKGCVGVSTYTDTSFIPTPRPDANIYITVNGQISNINYINSCLGDVTQFTHSYSLTIDSILWDFGDNNTSSLENPTHTYANAGTYNVNTTIISGSETYSASREITIFENPNLNPDVNLTQCDNDTDGITTFNLFEANSQLINNPNDFSISYYLNENEAISGVNPITNAINYENQNPNSEIIWARVENNAGCFSTSQISLNVSTSQIPESFMRDFYECEDSVDTGISTFDFSSAESEILALFPAGQQLEISFYQTENDAFLEINPVTNLSNYQNNDSPESQNIFVRVENVLNSNCIGLGHHITLYSEPIPFQTGPYVFEQCDEGGDGVEFFDTSGIENTLSSLQPGDITITYEDEFGNALPSPLPNPLEVTMPIYNVFAKMTIENPNLPNGGCSNVESIAFVINNAINTVQLQPFTDCDEDGDGVFTFDTSGLEQNMVPDLDDSIDIVYEDEDGNTISSPFPDNFTTATQTITAFITAQNGINPDCTDVIEIEFIVSEKPNANSMEDIFICDDPSNDGIETFTLSDFDAEFLGDQSSDIFEVSYFENSTNAESNINPLPNDYQVDENNQMIYARIQHVENQSCFDISSFEININYLPVAYAPEKLIVCDTQGNDEVEEFDLSIQDNAILNDQLAVENAISYYTTLEDAENNTNAINGLYSNATNPQTIYARIENISAPSCFSTTSFEIEVFDSPVIDIAEEVILCQNEDLTISINDIYDDYLWSTGETSSSISINEPGNYEISVFKNYEDFSCETTTSFEVIPSDEAIINDLTIVDWTQSNNAISILVEGDGDYEYSLDGITYQESNTFNNLTEYEYLVHVRDKNGCGEALRQVYLLDYPQFFTPNADGFNDRWQIINAKQKVFTKIYIFNRYGKLITDLSPNSSGWDGTMNGKPMPSNDYWFRVEREDGRTHTGHFTLKR